MIYDGKEEVSFVKRVRGKVIGKTGVVNGCSINARRAPPPPGPDRCGGDDGVGVRAEPSFGGAPVVCTRGYALQVC